MNYITRKQMAQVDKVAMSTYGLKIESMMENAGRNLARFVSRLKPRSVIVLYGKGNNGGGGLVAARHLAIHGVRVSIIPASKVVNNNVSGQLKILRKMGIRPSKEMRKADVIIDALIGYNLEDSPRGKFAYLIDKANEMKKSGTRIVSLDVPTGLDTSTGKLNEPYVKANYTLTLALPKVGLEKIKGVFLANVGIPNSVYKKLGIKVENYFSKEDIVRV